MTKILIIGFQHSGTTMLSLLMQAHPQISRLYNEERLIELDKPKEFIMFIVGDEVYPNGKKMAWGDKVPWIDGKGDRIIRLSKRWIKFFGKDARIIHILRHPLDVALSISLDMYKHDLKLILKSDPKVIDFVNSNKKAATVLFEDLVTNPEEKLKSIFSFCNLKHDKKTIRKIMNTELKFGKINPDRAFAHKTKKLNIDVDYTKLINMTINRL